MKNLLVGILILSATALPAAPKPEAAAASTTARKAQSMVSSNTQQVMATIPFAFRAGKAVLPAGTYIVAFDSVNQVSWIENVAGRAKVVSLNAYVKPGPEPRLEFKRDGNVMVLQPESGTEDAREAGRRTAVAQQRQDPAPEGREGR